MTESAPMSSWEVLQSFLDASKEDPRITPFHVSLYVAIFYAWTMSGSGDPLILCKSAIMPLAKIQARSTYNQCLRDLNAFGYILYMPSYDPRGRTVVFLEIDHSAIRMANH
jgi:hypothetical protein